MNDLRHELQGAAHSSALAYFRIIFGLTMVWESSRYLLRTWIQRYYVNPDFHFTYWPFTFVDPWPEPFMTFHVVLIGVAGLFVALGLFYRIAATSLFLLFTYFFLLDQARYLNHFYLVSLLSFLMIFLPAHRALSLDARRHPAIASATVPAWTLGLLRFQIAVPYFFGGVAKITHDWLAGEPFRHWLANASDFPIIGPLFLHEPVVKLFVYGGLIGDLAVAPLLLIRQTRVLGISWMLAFHLLNSRLFKIGIFPWMMIMATFIFLPSDWLHRVAEDVRERKPGPLRMMIGFGTVGLVYGSLVPSQPSLVNAVVATFGMAMLGWEIARWGWDATPRETLPSIQISTLPLVLTGVWVFLQVTIPLRHFLVPGNVHWTEEGHRWSWHMKLRDKDLERLVIRVHRPDGPTIRIRQSHDNLADHQWRKMGQTPDMLVQYAHHLRDQYGPDAKVTMESYVSLNGRDEQLLLDPDRDIASVPLPWPVPGDFIVPLYEPLPERK